MNAFDFCTGKGTPEVPDAVHDDRLCCVDARRLIAGATSVIDL